MKTVIHRERYSAPGSVHDFPDAGLKIKNGEPTVVTDEQAAVLLTNPDVSLVETAREKPAESAPVAAIDRPAVKAAVAAAKASVTEAA